MSKRKRAIESKLRWAGKKLERLASRGARRRTKMRLAMRISRYRKQLWELVPVVHDFLNVEFPDGRRGGE